MPINFIQLFFIYLFFLRSGGEGVVFRNIGTVLLELLPGNVMADWKLCLNVTKLYNERHGTESFLRS